MTAFEKLISTMPPESSVLDVGAMGLEGENTSLFLKSRFSDYTGINAKPVGEDILLGDVDTYDFGKQFDLIVLDFPIEKNLEDWSDEGLIKISKLLKPGGKLINYIMTTTEYGDEGITPPLIAKHRDEWWHGWENVGEKLNHLPGFTFYVSAQEERRPYITWVMLEKTSGL